MKKWAILKTDFANWRRSRRQLFATTFVILDRLAILRRESSRFESPQDRKKREGSRESHARKNV
jgi:hypothetical protein